MRWVRDENFNRDCAPAADATTMHFADEMVSLGEPDRVDALRRAAGSRSKKAKRTVRRWSARFRQRWRASLSNLAVQDVLPRPDLDQKAGASLEFQIGMGIQGHRTLWSLLLVIPPKWVRWTRGFRVQKSGHILVLFLGPWLSCP